MTARSSISRRMPTPIAGLKLTSAARTASQGCCSMHSCTSVPVAQWHAGNKRIAGASPAPRLQHLQLSHSTVVSSGSSSSTSPPQQWQRLQRPEQHERLEQLLNTIRLTAEEQSFILSKLPTHLDSDVLGTVQGNLQHLQQHRFKPASLFLREPRLLVTHLPEWYTFFQAYGFTEDQWQHILWEAPEALANATLISAGQTMLVLKRLGLDEYGIKQMCVYYPQLLSMKESEVEELVQLVAKHNATHGFE